jgi:hypothetical protein
MLRDVPEVSDSDPNGGPVEFFHIDVFRVDRYGAPIGTARVDRMTDYPMTESECRIMMRKFTGRNGIAYLLTRVRDE